MIVNSEFLHLEHDGKILLVNVDGEGPEIPIIGRSYHEDGIAIRLPTKEEVAIMGINWTKRRTNKIRLGEQDFTVTYGTPIIEWPSSWAWKDSVISDSQVDPLVRESVYRTLHRVVSKVIIVNDEDEVVLAKVSRGFFTGCWTLPGGFVDYGEHPRDAAQREAMEELGVSIKIPDPLGEVSDPMKGKSEHIVQNSIFNDEGINWLSYTYLCRTNLDGQEITPKVGEIEEARWFSKSVALEKMVSVFDVEAIKKLL